MAAKMLEADSNTGEPYINSIVDPVTHKNLKRANCFETNGDVKYGGCDILPNNNICGEKIRVCYSDGDCSSKNDVMSSSKADSCSPSGESTPDAPLQECDIHSDQISDSSDGTRQQIIQQVSPDSQSNRMEHASHLPSDFMSGSDSAKTKVPFISVADVSNGVIKKSTNKMSKSNKKKLSMSAGRGRPRKALVATYHSQISGDKNTIKIRIKKNSMTTQVQLTPNKKKSGRRKRNKNPSDTDASDYDTPSKRIKVSADAENSLKEEQHEPQDQSGWGNDIPEKVLHKIFQNACLQEGSLPILVRLCRVCKLWRNVALTPSLWQRVDLNWVREKFRIDQRLHWLIENRLSNCQDLNLGIWEVRNIQLALESLVGHCPNLRGLNLSGWKGLNADNLKYLTTECKNLERLDLSSINSSSAINAQPLVNLTQTMSGRLTHLVLAHNKLAGFTQIMAALAGNCPNLQLLDISNIGTSHNSALLHVEKLQSGCPKLKVLRITNSQIWLAPASLPDQVASPGFPLLEELSLAGIEDDQTTTARSVDDDGIERILKNSTKLRLLDVRGCNRLTDSGLVKVPAWDLEHLFLSACYVTRTQNAGLELIVQKWSHSLLEVDLAWSTATASLDAAVFALAEKGLESPLRILNLCGSSVSLEPVKAVLTKCPNLHSINLQSCRALPRGIKRLFSGSAVDELRQTLQGKPKTEVNESDTEQPSPEQGSVQ